MLGILVPELNRLQRSKTADGLGFWQLFCVLSQNQCVFGRAAPGESYQRQIIRQGGRQQLQRMDNKIHPALPKGLLQIPGLIQVVSGSVHGHQLHRGVGESLSDRRQHQLALFHRRGGIPNAEFDAHRNSSCQGTENFFLSYPISREASSGTINKTPQRQFLYGV